MASADSVLNTIKIEDIYALGNAWIKLGDELHERRVAVDSDVAGMEWTGAAGDAARRAWSDATAKNLDDAIETAWTIGQTINRYADKLHEAAAEYAKKLNAMMWADILGALLSAVFFYLGPLLESVLAMIGQLIARLIPVIASMAGRLGPVGSAVVGSVGGAVIGSASGLAFDLGVGAAGAGIAHTDYDIDWGSEALTLGIGGGFGAVAGGLGGYHGVPKPGSPGGIPKGSPPVKTPPVPKTDHTGGFTTAPGGGKDSSFTHAPAQSRRGGNDSVPSGSGKAVPPVRGGVSANDSTPTSSGPATGNRTHDVGMPPPPVSRREDSGNQRTTGAPAPFTTRTESEKASYSPGDRSGGDGARSTPPPVTTPRQGKPDGAAAGGTPPRPAPGDRVTEHPLPGGDGSGAGGRDQGSRTVPPPTPEQGRPQSAPPAREPGKPAPGLPGGDRTQHEGTRGDAPVSKPPVRDQVPGTTTPPTEPVGPTPGGGRPGSDGTSRTPVRGDSVTPPPARDPGSHSTPVTHGDTPPPARGERGEGDGPLPGTGGRGGDTHAIVPPPASERPGNRPGGSSGHGDDTSRVTQRPPTGGHSERTDDQGVPMPPRHGDPAEGVRTGGGSDHVTQPPANRGGDHGVTGDPARQSGGADRPGSSAPGGGPRATDDAGSRDGSPRASRPAPGDQPATPQPARRPDSDGRTQQSSAGERSVPGTSRTGDGHETHSAPPARGDRRGPGADGGGAKRTGTEGESRVGKPMADSDGTGRAPLRESPGWSQRRVDRMWRDAQDSGLPEGRTRALYDDWVDARISGDKTAENRAASAWADALGDARREQQLNGMRDQRIPRTPGHDDTSSSVLPKPADGRGTGGGTREGAAPDGSRSGGSREAGAGRGSGGDGSRTTRTGFGDGEDGGHESRTGRDGDGASRVGEPGSREEGLGASPLRESPGWNRHRLDAMWEDARGSGLPAAKTRELHDDWVRARATGDSAAERRAASAWFDAVGDARREQQHDDQRVTGSRTRDDTSSSVGPKPADGLGTGGGTREGAAPGGSRSGGSREAGAGRGSGGDGSRTTRTGFGDGEDDARGGKDGGHGDRTGRDGRWDDDARDRRTERGGEDQDEHGDGSWRFTGDDGLVPERSGDVRVTFAEPERSSVPDWLDSLNNRKRDDLWDEIHGNKGADTQPPPAPAHERGPAPARGNESPDVAPPARDHDDTSSVPVPRNSGDSTPAPAPRPVKDPSAAPSGPEVHEGVLREQGTLDDSQGRHPRHRDDGHEPVARKNPASPDEWGRAMERYARGQGLDAHEAARFGSAYREARTHTDEAAWSRVEEGLSQRLLDRQIAQRVANRTPAEWGDLVRRYAESHGMTPKEAAGWAKQAERAWGPGGDVARFRERFDQRVEEIGAKRQEGVAGETSRPVGDEPKAPAPAEGAPAPAEDAPASRPVKKEDVSAPPSGHDVYEGVLRDQGILKDDQGVHGHTRDRVHEEKTPVSEPEKAPVAEPVRKPVADEGQRERIAELSPDAWGRAMERYARGQGLDAKEAARFGSAYREARMEGDESGWRRVEDGVASRLLDRAIDSRVANRTPGEWGDLVRRYGESHGMTSKEAAGWAKHAERAWSPGGDVSRFRERFQQRVEEVAAARTTDEETRTPPPATRTGKDAGTRATAVPVKDGERAAPASDPAASHEQRPRKGESTRDTASKEASPRDTTAADERTTARTTSDETRTPSGDMPTRGPDDVASMEGEPKREVGDSIPAGIRSTSEADGSAPAVAKPAPETDEPAAGTVAPAPAAPATTAPARPTSDPAKERPATDEPTPAKANPSPATRRPAPASAESVPATSEPNPAHTRPTSVTGEPTSAHTRPTSVTGEPTPANAEPVGAPDSAPARLAPTTDEPVPAPVAPTAHTPAQTPSARVVGDDSEEPVRLVPHAPGQSSASGRPPQIIERWLESSGTARRSEPLRSVDRAVRRLAEGWGGADEAALRNRVTREIESWQGTKSGKSSRDDAISRLKRAIGQRAAESAAATAMPAPAQGRRPRDLGRASALPLLPVPGHRVEVEGFAPARGFEAEVHLMRVAVPHHVDDRSFDTLVSVNGLLDITIDHVGQHAVLEIVSRPTRSLVHGEDDGRAEPEAVETAFRDALYRIANAAPTIAFSKIFPKSHGYTVDMDADGLSLQEHPSAQMLVHHTVAVPVAGYPELLRHVLEHMRAAAGAELKAAHKDGHQALVRGEAGGQRFLDWLRANPEYGANVPASDLPDLVGALTLGYVQAAAAFRGRRPGSHAKDWAAATSRDSLGAVRASLGVAPRAFLEDQADVLAREMAGALDLYGDPLAQPLRKLGPEDPPTLGEYLDNLLRERPTRAVRQYEALEVRSDFDELDSNPDHKGKARIVPAVVRVEVRSYAPADSRDDDVIAQSATLAKVSLETYNEARARRDLPPVGGPVLHSAPPAPVLDRPRGAGFESPRPGSAPSSVPSSATELPPALAALAAALPGMSARERSARVAALAPGERARLVADSSLVRQLRGTLGDDAFRQLAAEWLVVVPDGVHDPVEARAEAQRLVEEMTADADVAEALLTTGRQLLVVPRVVPFTDLDAFHGLHGTPGRSLTTARGGYARGRAGVPEENLLGEPATVHGAGTYADGYSSARHEWAHAVESVLDAADRQWIKEVYDAKRAAQAAGESVHWPDGAFPNYSSSDPHEYFAQLTTAYHAANAGIDELSGSRRNNGADWVEQHDPALLPLLQRVYGPGRPAARDGLDNPLTLTAFRAFWARVEEASAPAPAPVAPVASADEPHPLVPRTAPGSTVRHLAPPAGDGSAARAAIDPRMAGVLRRAFGAGIEGSGQFLPLYTALHTLVGAHQATPRFTGTPFDFDTVARRVLRVDPGERIGPQRRMEALQTVSSASRAGWTGDLPSLVAYRVGRLGALGPGSVLTDAHGGFLGRNLTRRPGLTLDAGRVLAPGDDGLLYAAPGPWTGTRPHVVVAERDDASGGVLVALGNGGTIPLDEDEFAALIAADPWRDPDAAVVVGVVPRTGDTSEVLTRLVADAARTRAWGVTRPYRLQPGADGVRFFAFPPVADDETVPVGLWVPGDPGLVPAAGPTIQASDGTTFTDEDVRSYPIVTSDGRELTGRAHPDEGDVARREEALRQVSDMLYYYDDLEAIPGLTRGASGPLLLLPRGLGGAYVSIGHGERGRIVLPRRSTDANHAVPPRELGGVLARRPSVQRLAPDVPLWLLWCEIAMVRPGADPLVRPAAAQEVANQTGHPVLASDAPVAIEEAHDGNPARVVKVDNPARPRYRWYQFLPEPDGRRLGALADLAGLPADTARRTTRVLRWVRALRLAHGFDIDTHPERQEEFHALLAGFGALERQRLWQGAEPLTWHELEDLTHASARQSGIEPGPVTAGTLHGMLYAAGAGTLRLPAPRQGGEVRQAPPVPERAASGSSDVLLAPPTPPAPTREAPAGSDRVADIVRMFEEMSRRAEEHEAAETRSAPEAGTRSAPEEERSAGTETAPSDEAAPETVPVTRAPVPAAERAVPLPADEHPVAVREDPADPEAHVRATQDAHLEEWGLERVNTLSGGDTLANVLIAVAPAETAALVEDQPLATPSQLRTELAQKLAADLARPEAQRTLGLPADSPSPGVPLLPEAEPDDLVAGVRSGDGAVASEWLTLAVAAPVLGLRLTVLLSDGRTWTVGPREGREAVLLQTPPDNPLTALWSATQATDAARGTARTTPPPPAVRPAATTAPPPARTVPETFFGTETRPVPESRRPARTTPAPHPAETAPAPRTTPLDPRTEEETPARTGTTPETGTVVPAREETTPRETGTGVPPSEAASTAETETVVGPREEVTTRETGVPPHEEGTTRETETLLPPREEVTTTETTEPPVTTETRETTETLPAFSPYIQAYGTRHDGSVGFVAWELPSAEVLDGLRAQIMTALRIEPGSTREEVRTSLDEALGSAEIAENLPQVRGRRGHRLTVRVGDVAHTVDVRLRLTAPSPDLRTGITRNLPHTRRLERQSEGVQALTSTQGSGTSRTFTLPHVMLPEPLRGPVRWVAVTVAPSVTLRQRTLNVGLSESLSVKVLQRAGDDAGAVRFDAVWQVRVDAGADNAEGWGEERVHGPMYLWFPGNRIGAEGTAVTLPRAAGLDTFPLWGVEDVLDTDLRPAQVLGHPELPGLRDLGEGSRQALEDFLDEQLNRGSLHLQRDRGVMSPLLTDDRGTALGLVRVRAVVTPGEPSARTADGDKSLEIRFTHSTGTDRTARVVSGAGLNVNVAPGFTASTAAGHPGAADRWGGRVYGRFLGSWQSGDTLTTGSKAGLMHGFTTNRGQLLTPAAVTYEFTFLRAGGGMQGPVRVERGEESVRLRLLPQDTAAGAAPADEELRALPPHLDSLAAIGYTAVPLTLDGVDEIFDRAERRLRELHYLPPLEHRGWEGQLQARRARAQLANLQRFEQLRSAIGRAAALPDGVEGGRPLWLELPTRTGTTRAELRLTVTRDRVPRAGETGAPAARHELRLPEVGTTTTGSHEARGTRERSSVLGTGAGFGGGPRQPAGNWAVDYGVDGVLNRTWTRSATAGSTVATEQILVNSKDGTEVFAVPARVALDLYEGTSPEPVARFAEPPAPPRPATGTPPFEGVVIDTETEEDTPGLDVPPGTETIRLGDLPPRPDTAPGTGTTRADDTEGTGTTRTEGTDDTEDTRTEGTEETARERAGTEEAVVPRPLQAPPGTAPATVRLAVSYHRTEPGAPRAPETGTGTEAPAGPREVPEVPAYTIRAPRTGPGQDSDRTRLGLVDADGNPLPGVTRLPDDATADVFRGSEAIQEALRLVAAGTYPGRPDPGTFGHVAGALARGAAALPFVSSAGAHLAGQDPRDRGAFANESAYQQLRVASLLARAHQILNGVYTAEGIVLPGLGADRHLAVDVRGYLHHPTVQATFPVSGRNDVNATDLAATRRTRGSAVTGNFELTAQRGAARPTPQGTVARIIQGNLGGTFSRTHRGEHFDDVAATSATIRGAKEGAGQHLVTADLTLLLTVRRGTANVLGNAVGLGGAEDITLAIDVPRAVQFRLSPTQLLREARWFAGIEGVAVPAAPSETVPLPDDFARTRAPGFGAVLAVTQLDDAITRRPRRDRLGREAIQLVERVAPGVTRPGHIAHLPGVASRIADLTAPPGLRALVARGSVSLWFRYGARADAQLVELTLHAETEAQTPALRRVQGRPGAQKTGIEQQSTHAPGNRIESDTVSRVVTGLLDLGLRAPRVRSTGYTDRWSALPSASRSHALTRRSDRTADERFWQRTDSVADFDRVGYRLTASVRTALIPSDVFDLLGGLLGRALTAVANRGENSVPRAALDGLLRGVPAQEVTVPADVALRFAAADTLAHATGERTAEATAEWTPLRPRVSEEDPRLAPADEERAEDERPLRVHPRFVPTGTTPLSHFNAFPELAEAIRAVSPGVAGHWGLTADSNPDAADARLTELAHAGRGAALTAPGTAAGLHPRMPGSWPVLSENGSRVSLQVSLYAPRPFAPGTSDIAADSARTRTRVNVSTASSSQGLELGQRFAFSATRRNHYVTGGGQPLLSGQPVTRGTDSNVTTGAQHRVQTGTASGGDTYTHLAHADVVVTVSGPEGVRYVTGSVTVRAGERDLLGYGVITTPSQPWAYDMAALLRERRPAPADPGEAGVAPAHDAADPRAWSREPATELPRVLASGLSPEPDDVQLWVDLGDDPDGSVLAHALYVGTRVAEIAHRRVELAVRDATGLRFWPLDADGSLADVTVTTRPGWEELRTAGRTYTAETAAEATAVEQRQPLEARLDGLSTAASETAVESERLRVLAEEAETPYEEARSTEAGVRDRRGDVADRLKRAEEDIPAREDQVKEAKRKLDAAKEHLDLAQKAAAPVPDGTPVPDATVRALREAEDARSEAVRVLGTREGALETVREDIDRLTEELGHLDEELKAAEKATETNWLTLAKIQKSHRTAAEKHEKAARELGEVTEEAHRLREAEQGHHALAQQTWQRMAGLAGRLSTDRCAELTGGSGFPLDTLTPSPRGR